MTSTVGFVSRTRPILDTPKFQDVYLEVTHNISICFGCQSLLMAVAMGQGFSCFAQPEGAQYCCFTFA